MGGYTESEQGRHAGSRGPVNDELTFVGSPGFEMGLRTDFRNGMVLRSFVLGSVNISTTDGWTQNARFGQRHRRRGRDRDHDPDGSLLDDEVTAGWQLQTSERTSFSVQYEENTRATSPVTAALGMKISILIAKGCRDSPRAPVP